MRRAWLAVMLSCAGLALPSAARAQNCADWQARLDAAEKQMSEITRKLPPLTRSLELVDRAAVGAADVEDDIAADQTRVETLKAKIAAGDASAETAAELKSATDRIGLMQLRAGKNFNKDTFYKQPAYLAVESASNKLRSDEADVKKEIAFVTDEMTKRQCPKKAAETTAEVTTDLLEGVWAGTWTFADPRAGTITLKLNGTGTPVSGTYAAVIGQGLRSTFDVSACKDVSSGRIRCDFAGTYEDNEKFMDVKGSVDMTLTGNTLVTLWKEAASPTVRWKPEKEIKGIIRVRDPIQLPITFKRQ